MVEVLTEMKPHLQAAKCIGIKQTADQLANAASKSKRLVFQRTNAAPGSPYMTCVACQRRTWIWVGRLGACQRRTWIWVSRLGACQRRTWIRVGPLYEWWAAYLDRDGPFFKLQTPSLDRGEPLDIHEIVMTGRTSGPEMLDPRREARVESRASQTFGMALPPRCVSADLPKAQPALPKRNAESN